MPRLSSHHRHHPAAGKRSQRLPFAAYKMPVLSRSGQLSYASTSTPSNFFTASCKSAMVLLAVLSRGGVSEPGFGWNIFRISLPKSLIIRQYDRVFRLRASKNICSIQNCFALQGEIILLDFEDENFLHTVVFMKFSAKKTENKPVWSEFVYASTA